MQKSTLPVGVKTLLKYYDEETLDMDCPVQRHSGQWNNMQQSLLLHSILVEYIVPNIYFRKEIKDNKSYFSVLDGKQRLSTLFSYIADEWTTHAKTPKAKIDGVEYDIALKKFSELDEDLKSAILSYRFTIFQLENCTDDEIEEVFSRLNSGTSLTKIQMSRPKMGVILADWANTLVSKKFFQESINLTPAQIRHEDDFLMLVTAMMLLDNKFEDPFIIKTNASAAECLRFAEHIKNNYSDEKKETIELLVEYLSDCFGDKEYKFFKKNNIPIVMFVAQTAIDNNVPEEVFHDTIEEFFESGCTPAYTDASGSGNVKLVNIHTRIKELHNYLRSKLPEYFDDEDKNTEEQESDGIESENNESATETLADMGNSPDSESDGVSNFVLFHLRTNEEGQEQDDVYEVKSTDEEYLNGLGYNLARDNAELYDIEIDENSEDKPFSYSWEIIEGKSKEEIIKEYGMIMTP